MQRILKTLAVATFAFSVAGAQTPSGIVDVYTVKVKPEKRADFDGLAKKMADANRKNKGDRWIAYSVEYGEQNTVSFASVRENLAAIDSSSEAFMGALKESFGPAFPKLFQDMSNCAVSARSEIRRRRPDLSWNWPAEMADIEKYVGGSRWIRFRTVRVRPGRELEYEDSLKMVKAAFEKEPRARPTSVSQAMAGSPGGTYYFTTFGKSLGDFDPKPGSVPLRERMGTEAYEQNEKSTREDVIMGEWTIARLVPELSNPTDGIAAGDPDFWHPKTAAPKPMSKPKTTASAKTGM